MVSRENPMSRRLMVELRAVTREIKSGNLDWLLQCDTVDDNLMKWIVGMSFPEDSDLQRSLNSYAVHEFDESLNKLTFQVRFPPEYPEVAPEIWLKNPRLKYAAGSNITFGGRVCIQMLTSTFWTPATNMSAVLGEVRSCLLAEGATVDTSCIVKPYLEPPPMLDRLRSDAYPTANDFQADFIQVISPFEAGPFFGDLNRLEATDKIALSMKHGEQIYGLGTRMKMPLMFEIKTQRGRKTHCGLFDFLGGLPPDVAILPKWVMNDIGLEERALVRVRGVSLDLITQVKIQPHSIDFHMALRESGADSSLLLTETLRRFSALTEDTSIPIEIGSTAHSVQILELQPNAAVRIIDTDVVNDFEFKVEIEFAPDLESDEDKKAHAEKLMNRHQARIKQKEDELAASKNKREQAIRRHFERARNAAKQEAGDVDGKEGSVSLRVNFPGAPPIDVKFPDGVSAATLMAVVLASDWAEKQSPWCVRLVCNYPKRTLTKDDKITSEMNRSVVSVKEELPPTGDDEVLQVVEREDAAEEELKKEAAKVASMKDAAQGFFARLMDRTFSGRGDAQSSQQAADGELDEFALQEQTLKMFEVQRFIQTGMHPEEALAMVESGASAPTSATSSRPPPAPSFIPPPRHPERPPRTDKERKLEQITNCTGCDDDTALRLLETNGEDVERAINEFFDAM